MYPWLEAPWAQLLALVSQARMPHALLLIGASHIGKRQLAENLEQVLLCHQPTQSGACGRCRACYLSLQASHPDSLHVGQNEDGISIDDIREITDFLNQTAHQEHAKVVILPQVEALNKASANALLKTLEEPLGTSFLILLASTPVLMPTLKSRCFIINIPLPSPSIAHNWLAQQYPHCDHEQLQWSIALARGSPLKAQELLNSPVYQKGSDAISRFLASNHGKFLQNEDIQQFITMYPTETLYLFYYWVTNIIKKKGFTDFLDTQALFNFLDKVLEARKSVFHPGINKTLLIESLFFQWQQVAINDNK